MTFTIRSLINHPTAQRCNYTVECCICHRQWPEEDAFTEAKNPSVHYCGPCTDFMADSETESGVEHDCTPTTLVIVEAP